MATSTAHSTPPAGKSARSANMRANRRRDTKPELAVRSGLHRLGFRFRVDFRIGSGRGAPRPDIAFTRAKVAVFVDGCFWHGCPEHGGTPSINNEYWVPKLARNRQRDRDNDAALTAAGWRVLRFWEHDDAPRAIAEISRAVRERLAAQDAKHGEGQWWPSS